MRSWRRTAYRAVRPILFAADAEAIHHLTLSALALAGRSAPGRALCAAASGASSGPAPVELMGLRFRNRVGVAAGFDKDGVAIRGWAALGLGYVELGTVTPRPQPGSTRPRLFRLTADEALVNRMGFNNAGASALARRISHARPSLPDGFIVGVNIGRNRDTQDAQAIDDYVVAAREVAPVADYVVVNVSSPNTPGLRDLQQPDRIGSLLSAVIAVVDGRPLVVKLSPDLDESQLNELVDAIAGAGARGLILGNTTVRREGLRSSAVPADGGLSGRPLLEGTLAAVVRARERAGLGLAIVGSGGIGSAEDARAAVDAGADLIELWTGLIYAGPGLIGESMLATRSRGGV